MSQKTTILAAVSSYYKAGGDIIGVFANLALKVCLPSKTYSIEGIQKKISSQFGIKIPQEVVKTLIKRNKKNGHLSFTNINRKTITLTEKGKEEQKAIDQQLSKSSRERHAVLKKLADHTGNKIPTNTLETALNNYIEKTAFEAAQILEEGNQNKRPAQNLNDEITNFFIEMEKSDQRTYEILKSILFGKIVATALIKGDFQEKAKFAPITIYLDSNIVFSLMGLDRDKYNIPTKELIEIAKKLGCKLKVFTSTKQEICNKLAGYIQAEQDYFEEIEVESIYYTLKTQGKTSVDVKEMIDDIEELLRKLDIEIDFVTDVYGIHKKRSHQFGKMDSYMGEKSQNSKIHDFNAIYSIRELRGKKTYIIEKSAYIFLTGDYSLSEFDYCEMYHESVGTFPEVVSRNELTRLLWLKSYSGNESTFMHNLLLSHTSSDAISRPVWDAFIDETRKRKAKGEVTDEDIVRIVSLNETQKMLKGKGKKAIKPILDKNKLAKAKEQQKLADQKAQKASEKIGNQRKTLAKQELTIALKNKELEEKTQQLISLERSLENKCRKKWSWIFNGGILTFFVALSVLFIWIILKLDLDISAIASVLTIILGCSTFLGFAYFLISDGSEIPPFLRKKKNEKLNEMIISCRDKKKDALLKS